jgi:hypothetical protein
MGTLKRKVGAIMGSALLVGGLLAGPPASAAQLSGEESCPGQFGYLTATTVGTTRLVPPGSVYTWAYMTGGTRTRIATWWNGESKSGGGPWSAYGSTSVSGTNAFCRSAG